MIPRDLPSAIFLVPECGWLGGRFDPTLTTRPNESYVRLAGRAAACMQEKVKAGIIKESQIPFELIRTECLRGMNPAHMSASEAKRYFNCQFGD